ncbi:MAG: hypothetical protein FD145_515 [Candidatus Saganbacteria bacterium]|uniref:PorV/PorQ family protein n=1 Tax=Candidatus Saganbacteria bacterium TaxID=2575572 RepID=A0A833NXC7_UNCSA|nr:MAG: hypothetical protein FD145_515 [Candidatus Saganbacteria bacterium]
MRKLITYFLLLIVFNFFIVGIVFAQAIAPDPTRLSVGGRILGMGKAFVGLTDDVGALYTNPAGLGNIADWQITSMSGNFLEDFTYLNIAGVYPTNFGVFGAGYTSSTIAGGYATRVKEGSNPNDPVYEIDPTQPTINYFNNVGIISYGNKLQNFKIPFSIPYETLFGANLKLFFAGMSGDGITQGSASGRELDLGILVKLNPWLSLGSTVQNILPSSMGGKLTYATGHEESYPAVWENGIAVNLKKLNGLNVKLLFDFDYYPTRKGYPIIYHTGFEWIPVNLVSIRAGIDQDAAGDGSGSKLSAISNLTAGVGLNYNNFKFDYAFHQFTGAAGMTNSFFSLSYDHSFNAKDTAKAKSKWDIEKVITPEAKSVIVVPPKKIPAKTVKGGAKNVKKKSAK